MMHETGISLNLLKENNSSICESGRHDDSKMWNFYWVWEFLKI